MLSRSAQGLYWISRYLERAQYGCRLLAGQLEAIEDPAARLKRYEEMVANAYENGKALNSATHFSVDDTIDPAHTRHWLSSLLRSVRVEPRHGKKRPAIDAW